MSEKITLSGVPETMLQTVYARAKETKTRGAITDNKAVEIIDRLDYDFSMADKDAAMHSGVIARTIVLDKLVKTYLAGHGGAVVVNIACGLDTRCYRMSDYSHWYNLDLPETIAVRDALLPALEREKNIPCNLNDTSWFSEIDASGGAVFFAAGVFYYFLTPQVKALVCAMAEAFPGGKLVFDAANRKAVKLMLKTWLKDAEIKDVGAYFAVTDARRELSAWSDRLRVSSRGYMLGYNDLRNQNVRKFFRFLSKVGDGMMNMQIVRLDFAKENKKHE